MQPYTPKEPYSAKSKPFTQRDSTTTPFDPYNGRGNREYFLLIDETHFLLIDSENRLLIESPTPPFTKIQPYTASDSPFTPKDRHSAIPSPYEAIMTPYTHI